MVSHTSIRAGQVTNACPCPCVCVCACAHADRHACKAGDIRWALLRQDKDGIFECQHLSDVCPFRFSKLNIGLPPTHWQAKFQKTVGPVTEGAVLFIGTSGFWEEYRDNSDTSAEALEAQVLKDVNEFVRNHKGDVGEALPALADFWKNKISNKLLDKVCVCAFSPFSPAGKGAPLPADLPTCLSVCQMSMPRASLLACLLREYRDFAVLACILIPAAPGESGMY